MPHDRYEGCGVWSIQNGKTSHYVRQYAHVGESLNKPITEYFLRDGKGWRKVGSAKLSIIPSLAVGSIKTYTDIFQIIQEHGLEVASLLLGFEEDSLPDRRPLQELALLAKYGKPMLAWLEKIAEIDAGIKQFFESKGVTFWRECTSDIWMYIGEGETYNCRMGVSPFIGQCIATSFRGIFPLPSPYIDVIDLDKNWYATLRFAGIVSEDMSMSEVLTLMVGAELANWLHDNLSPEFN